MSDDSQSMYYLLSTIPQVLAGAVSLLAVFWIFKNNILSQSIVEIGKEAKDLLKDEEAVESDKDYRELSSAVAVGGTRKIEPILKRLSNSTRYGMTIEEIKTLQRGVRKRNHVMRITRNWLLVSLLLCTFTIVASILILKLTSFQSPVFLWIDIGFFVASLISILFTIKTAIGYKVKDTGNILLPWIEKSVKICLSRRRRRARKRYLAIKRKSKHSI